MEIVSCFVFLFAGGLSFLIYRIGIKDAMSVLKNSELPPLTGHREEYVPEKAEADFLAQYSDLMNYNFDKAENSNE